MQTAKERPTLLQNRFAANLKQARWTLGISQQALATKIGIPRTYISDLERGRYCPNLAMVDQICEAIGIDVCVLLRPAKAPPRMD